MYGGSSKVVWTFAVPEGCMNANLVVKYSDAQSEREFLFVPYSVFNVVEVVRSGDPSGIPHRITLQAAVDNSLEPEDLPLAPWY